MEVSGGGTLRGGGEAAYARLVESVVLAPVRAALMRDWKVGFTDCYTPRCILCII